MTLLGHEREMLGLYVSDHPLLGLEHVLSSGTDAPSASCCSTRSGPTTARSPSAAWSPRCSARSPRAATPGRSSPLEDLDGGIDVMLCPERLPARQHLPRRGRDHHGAAASCPARRTSPTIKAQEVTVPDLSDGPVRAGRDQPAVDPVHRRPWSSSSRTCSATHPGMTEVQLKLLARTSTTVLRLDDRLRVTPTPGAVRRPQAAARARMSERVTEAPRRTGRAAAGAAWRRAGAGRG